MTQLNIFDICANNHGGNENSVEANLQSKRSASSIRALILDFIIGTEFKGATCDQIEEALNLSHQTASARCSELKAQGKVRIAGKRMTRNGCNASILVAV